MEGWEGEGRKGRGGEEFIPQCSLAVDATVHDFKSYVQKLPYKAVTVNLETNIMINSIAQGLSRNSDCFKTFNILLSLYTSFPLVAVFVSVR